jgi:hypothetical protein
VKPIWVAFFEGGNELLLLWVAHDPAFLTLRRFHFQNIPPVFLSRFQRP